MSLKASGTVDSVNGIEHKPSSSGNGGGQGTSSGRGKGKNGDRGDNKKPSTSWVNGHLQKGHVVMKLYDMFPEKTSKEAAVKAASGFVEIKEFKTRFGKPMFVAAFSTNEAATKAMDSAKIKGTMWVQRPSGQGFH